MTFAYERDQRLDLDNRQEVDGIFPTFDYPKPGQNFVPAVTFWRAAPLAMWLSVMQYT